MCDFILFCNWARPKPSSFLLKYFFGCHLLAHWIRLSSSGGAQILWVFENRSRGKEKAKRVFVSSALKYRCAGVPATALASSQPMNFVCSLHLFAWPILAYRTNHFLRRLLGTITRTGPGCCGFHFYFDETRGDFSDMYHYWELFLFCSHLINACLVRLKLIWLKIRFLSNMWTKTVAVPCLSIIILPVIEIYILFPKRNAKCKDIPFSHIIFNDPSDFWGPK